MEPGQIIEGDEQPAGFNTRPGSEWTNDETSRCIGWVLEDPQLRSLLRYAKHVLGKLYTVQDAEDVVQDFLTGNLREALLRFDPERGRLWTYIQICLRQECLRFERKVRRHPSSFAVVAENSFAETPRWVVELADQDPNPEVSAQQEETQRLVQASINRLPPKFAEVVVLHYLMGKKVAEIASDLGITVANVKVRLCRARQLLRGLMRKEWAP